MRGKILICFYVVLISLALMTANHAEARVSIGSAVVGGAVGYMIGKSGNAEASPQVKQSSKFTNGLPKGHTIIECRSNFGDTCYLVKEGHVTPELWGSLMGYKKLYRKEIRYVNGGYIIIMEVSK